MKSNPNNDRVTENTRLQIEALYFCRFLYIETSKPHWLLYVNVIICINVNKYILLSHCTYRGADKSLAQPGGKQANISVRMAWISFNALPCRKRNLMTARVSILLKSCAPLTCFRACFLPGRAKDLSAPRYISCDAHNKQRFVSVNSITWLAFGMETHFVHCAVRPETLNTIPMKFSLQRVKINIRRS